MPILSSLAPSVAFLFVMFCVVLLTACNVTDSGSDYEIDSDVMQMSDTATRDGSTSSDAARDLDLSPADMESADMTGVEDVGTDGMATTDMRGDTGCPKGEQICDGTCVDTSTSEEYCGSCTNSCQAELFCIDGMCEEHNIAGPCNGLEDCPVSDTCASESVSGVQDGVCVLQCSAASDCPTGTLCISQSMGSINLCLVECDGTDPGTCRDEFTCQETSSGWVCAPPQ